jgi:hypothetical protein
VLAPAQNSNVCGSVLTSVGAVIESGACCSSQAATYPLSPAFFMRTMNQTGVVVATSKVSADVPVDPADGSSSLQPSWVAVDPE